MEPHTARREVDLLRGPRTAARVRAARVPQAGLRRTMRLRTRSNDCWAPMSEPSRLSRFVLPERPRRDRLLARRARARRWSPVTVELRHSSRDRCSSRHRIGPYKLLQEIGQGGMGVVFMAEQEKPVRRRVALKVIKAGMDTRPGGRPLRGRASGPGLDGSPQHRQGPRRRHHRHRPAFLRHGAGQGHPDHRVLRRGPAQPDERLELFIPVCQAIQHAHQKGIIHRDIKPSNVLVTLIDGQPVPKVIDFGVAKAIDQRLTEKTLFTQFGSIVGTLEYMSPEQAELSGMDVDTRSDVYALGVLLYELLTGTTPLEHERLREAGYAEILRRIKEEEPPKPSTRLSGSGERLASIAAVRGTEPARLTRAVRGDLDWIVMKALEKSRTRRYESAGGLARDVQRYLDDDAVEACPPSAGYRLRKFGRRHRGSVAVASAFAGLVIAGAASVSRWPCAPPGPSRRLDESAIVPSPPRPRRRDGGVKSRRARTIRLRCSPSSGTTCWPRHARRASRGAWAATPPFATRSTPRYPRVAEAFKNQPTVEASIRTELGGPISSLVNPGRAINELERAAQLFEAQLGPYHRDTLALVTNSRRPTGPPVAPLKPPSLHEATLKACEAMLGPDHHDTLISRGQPRPRPPHGRPPGPSHQGRRGDAERLRGHARARPS